MTEVRHFTIVANSLTNGNGSRTAIVLPVPEGKAVNLIAIHHLVHEHEISGGQRFCIQALNETPMAVPAGAQEFLDDESLFAMAIVYANHSAAAANAATGSVVAVPIVVPLYGMLAGSHLFFYARNDGGGTWTPRAELFYTVASVPEALAHALEMQGRH